MALVRWQATVQDGNGDYVVNPSVTVRNAADNSLADIFDDAGLAKANPFTGTSEGFVYFNAIPGRYIIEGVKGAETAEDWIVDLAATNNIAFYATRADAVVAANETDWPVGAIIADGKVSYRYNGTGTTIADMPGWVPHGGNSLAHWGVTGAGDETAKVQAAFDATDAAHLSGIGVDVTISSITIPAQNITWVCKDTRFVRSVASATPVVTIAGEFTFDELTVTTPGATSDAGIRVQGSNVTGGLLRANPIASTDGIGIHFQSVGSSYIDNIIIDQIRSVGFRTNFYLNKVERSEIKNIRGGNYVTGFYAVDCRNSRFNNGYFSTVHPLATGGPGNNGMLLESSVDDGSTNLWFNDWVVQDSGEHAYRIGGQATTSNVWIVNPTAKNTGAVGAAATGGTGIKVLGGTSTADNLHRNINIVNCIVEDCQTNATGQGNFCGIDVSNIDGLRVSGIVRNKVKAYCAWDGIFINCVKNADIDLRVLNARRHAARFLAESVASYPGMTGYTGDIRLSGSYHSAALAAPAIQFHDATATDDDGVFANISGNIEIMGGTAAIRAESLSAGAGYYSDISLYVSYSDPVSTAGAPAFQGTDDFTLDVTAPYYGSFSPNAGNGSRYFDPSTALHRVKYDGVWRTTLQATTTSTDTTTSRLHRTDDNMIFHALRRFGSYYPAGGSANIDNAVAGDAGLYEATLAGTFPEPSGFWWITTQAMYFGSASIQRAIRYASTGTPPSGANEYMRIRANDGTWGAWRRVYNSGSVVGTVSQSGGVPTGALTERGSNANGIYYKDASGEMRCTHNLLVKPAADATSGVKVATWTFPAVFVETSSIVVTGGLMSSSPNSRMGPTFGNPTGTTVAVYYHESVGTGNDVYVRVDAVGRWYVP